MIEIFKENKDLHLETAKLLYKNDSLTKASKERKNAKSVNFLMSYGGGASKLANTFNVPISDAKRTLQTYFETFPALKAFFERIGLEAKNKGFIEHNSVYPRKSYIGFYNEFITLYKHISRFRSYNWDVNPLVLEKYGYYNSKIPEAEREELFHPFKRASTAELKSKKGGGLGDLRLHAQSGYGCKFFGF